MKSNIFTKGRGGAFHLHCAFPTHFNMREFLPVFGFKKQTNEDVCCFFFFSFFFFFLMNDMQSLYLRCKLFANVFSFMAPIHFQWNRQTIFFFLKSPFMFGGLLGCTQGGKTSKTLLCFFRLYLMQVAVMCGEKRGNACTSDCFMSDLFFVRGHVCLEVGAHLQRGETSGISL